MAIIIGGAVLIYRDVERDGGVAAFAWIVFWPLGVYLWWRARHS